MVFEGFPLVVGWELTTVCNLRCAHCASSAGTPRENELSLDESLNICKQFPALLVQEVDFTGGEPLLSPNWTEIAACLNELKIPIRMVTNGVLLEQNIHRLLKAKITTVGVSLDGLEATHDHIRRRQGLFKEVTRGIRASIKAGIPTAVITAVNDRNANEIPELFKFIQELGVRHWQVQPTFSLGRARSDGELNLSEESFMKLGRFVYDNIDYCRDIGFNMMPADGVGYYTDLDTRSPAWKGCGAGKASCGITSAGKIKGCLSFPDDMIEGDLRQRDLWDIWYDDKSFAYNRIFSVKDLGSNCAGCEHGEQCLGGCVVMSISASGSFHNNPYCFSRILTT